MKDYREDIDLEAIKKQTIEMKIQPLSEEKIKEIKNIIMICKGLSLKEQEIKRYEIRNICE